MQTVLEMLKPALDRGCRFEIYTDEGLTVIDLNTEAKSHCYLKLINGEIKAFRRYGRVDTVESFEELLGLIQGCSHGRDFFSCAWRQVLEDFDALGPNWPH